jgi:hypothetical protein
VCEVLVSAGVGDISAGLGGAMRTYLAHTCVRCISRRCSRASSPRAWAQSRRSRGALHLVHAPLAVPPRDGVVRYPQLPSSGLRIADSSSSCYRVIQVDAHASLDKSWLMVRRLIHESAYAGLLGRAPIRWGLRARKLSLGGILRLAALVGS